MRVHQPGSHLMRGGRAEVDDWSWAQTKRRLSTLYRLAMPYKVRTFLAIVSLLVWGVVSTLVAVVAAAWPARRAARTEIVPALQHE